MSCPASEPPVATKATHFETKLIHHWDGYGNSAYSSDIDPSTDVWKAPAPSWRRKDSRPIVLSAGCERKEYVNVNDQEIVLYRDSYQQGKRCRSQPNWRPSQDFQRRRARYPKWQQLVHLKATPKTSTRSWLPLWSQRLNTENQTFMRCRSPMSSESQKQDQWGKTARMSVQVPLDDFSPLIWRYNWKKKLVWPVYVQVSPNALRRGHTPWNLSRHLIPTSWSLS